MRDSIVAPSRNGRDRLTYGPKERRLPRLVKREKPPHLDVQMFVGKRVRGELIPQKAANDALCEDDRI